MIDTGASPAAGANPGPLGGGLQLRYPARDLLPSGQLSKRPLQSEWEHARADTGHPTAPSRHVCSAVLRHQLCSPIGLQAVALAEGISVLVALCPALVRPLRRRLWLTAATSMVPFSRSECPGDSSSAGAVAATEAAAAEAEDTPSYHCGRCRREARTHTVCPRCFPFCSELAAVAWWQ